MLMKSRKPFGHWRLNSQQPHDLVIHTLMGYSVTYISILYFMPKEHMVMQANCSMMKKGCMLLTVIKQMLLPLRQVMI